MSVQLISILCLAAVVLAIVIGNVKKINIGIIALIFAYIIGSVLQGQFASSVTTLFPIKIMMYLVTVCYFYGFAILNGTMQALGDRMKQTGSFTICNLFRRIYCSCSRWRWTYGCYRNGSYSIPAC